MSKREVIEMCMESPLYFTMPLKTRLEFVKKFERLFPVNGLRADLLGWVRTGHFETSDFNNCT